MLAHGLISGEEFDELKDDIKENLPDWKENCRIFNDPDFDTGEDDLFWRVKRSAVHGWYRETGNIGILSPKTVEISAQKAYHIFIRHVHKKETRREATSPFAERGFSTV